MSVPATGAPGSCPFCSNPVDREDTDNYREVTSWVNGPKLQSPVLRTQTGRVAHEHCVHKLIEGQAPDQPDLFGEEYPDEPTALTLTHTAADIPDDLGWP